MEQTEATKKCPYCAETINAAAIVCRFCGKDLSPGAESVAVKPDHKKRNTLIAFAVTSGCLMCLCIFGPLMAAAFSKSTPSSTLRPGIRASLTPLRSQWTATPLPAEPIDLLQKEIEEELGASNRDVRRVTALYFDTSTNEINLTITANDNLTEEFIKIGIRSDIVDALKTIQQSDALLPYKTVVVVVTFPLVDVYGTSKEANVVIATYTRETLEKIDWDNFLSSNVYEVANQDSLYMHPSMRP